MLCKPVNAIQFYHYFYQWLADLSLHEPLRQPQKSAEDFLHTLQYISMQGIYLKDLNPEYNTEYNPSIVQFSQQTAATELRHLNHATAYTLSAKPMQV